MKKFLAIVIISIGCLLIAEESDIDVAIESLVRSRRSRDVVSLLSAETGSLCVDYSNLLCRVDLTERQILDKVGDYVKERVKSGAMTNFVVRGDVMGGVAVLANYGTDNDADVMAFIMTNCEDRLAVEVAAYEYYILSTNRYNALRMLNEGGVSVLPAEDKEAAYSGMFMGFERAASSSSCTNRIISLCLRVLDNKLPFYWQSDEYLCRWWCGYEASSNRYQYIVAALAENPPPMSTNFLYEIKAELEALPPGTMQQLSTNFLNGVWD